MSSVSSIELKYFVGGVALTVDRELQALTAL
jgi:hypothetical protein